MAKRVRASDRIGAAVLVLVAGSFGSAVADGAAPAKPKNALRWTTGSEVDCFGFDVYRADDKAGPFHLVTRKPIGAAGTTDVPSRYAFADESIRLDQAYWYYVERISMDGVRTRFTPLIFAQAKSRSAPNPVPVAESRRREP